MAKTTKKTYNDALLMIIVRPIITILFKVIYRPKILGKENIPKEGRIILAGNHTSNFDCLLLISSCKRNVHFLAKNELFTGIKKIIFSNLGLIPVNRKIKDKNSLLLSKKYLENEKLIGIFPEGTIGRNGMLPFKIGAVKLASDTNSCIVPFAITGKYKILKNDLKIEFGKPIEVNSDLDKENEKLRNVIIKMVGE